MGKPITYIDAIVEAQAEEMRRDPNVFVLGEDVGIYGGVFKATKGLMEEFGFWRCLDTPIAESLIVDAAIGAALMGMRPIAEIQFGDFIGGAHDPICQQAAKIYWRTGGTWKVPIVIRVANAWAMGTGVYHGQANEAWYMHVPGLKVVAPSTPYDAKGLLKSAVRDNNPVIYMEQKAIYRVPWLKEELPDDDYVVPIGKARLAREGKHVSFISYGWVVHNCLEAAKKLEEEKGVSAEVLDLRSILPYDKEAILETVKKTGKVIIAHDATKTAGVGAEIAAFISENAFEYLDGPIVRVCSYDTPVPFYSKMEKFWLPTADRLYEAGLKLFEY